MSTECPLFFVDRRGFLRATGGMLLAVSTWSLTGCGGGGGGFGSGGGAGGSGSGGVGNAGTLSLSTRSVPVTVTLPPGVPAPAGMQVRTFVGSAPVTGGSASVPIFEGGPQYAQVTDGAGNVLLMGWLTSGQNTLSAHTTAEVLLFYKVAGPLFTADFRTQAVALLAAHAATQPVADAIAVALKASPLALQNGDPGIKAALATAYGVLLPGGAAPAARPQGVSVSPPGPKSGVMLNQPGLNRIVLTNSYRRRARAFVDRVSSTDANGNKTSLFPPVQIGVYDLSPVTGTTSLLDTIATTAAGQVAYAPLDTAPISVPVLPVGSVKTEYAVTVIGLGANAGDVGMLSAERIAQLQTILLQSVFLDFLFPLVITSILPLAGDKIDEFCNKAQANSVLQDGLNAVVGLVPGFVDKVTSGDVLGALHLFLDTLYTSNTVKIAFLNFVQSVGTQVLPAEQAGLFAQLNARATAEKFLNVLTLADGLLTAIDSSIQVANVRLSDRADIWDVVVDAAKVKLSPTALELNPSDSATFKATVPDATGSDLLITYHWHINGTGGGKISTAANAGTDFGSSQDHVLYESGTGSGQDTITVEAFQAINNTRVSLGTASAPITIKPSSFLLAPAKAQLLAHEAQTLTLQPAPKPTGTASYLWSTTGQYGTLVPTSGAETDQATAIYTAGGALGADTVTCEVFDNYTDSTGAHHVSLGTASAALSVVDRKTQYFGSFSVDSVAGSNVCDGYDGGGYSLTAAAHFALMPGATSYTVHCYGFNDPFYYHTNGTSVTFSPSAPPPSIVITGGSAYLGLSGKGATCGSPTAGDYAYFNNRFAGIIVEVTVTY